MKRAAIGFTVALGLLAADEGRAQAPAWTERVRLSGSADAGLFGGGRDSVTPDDGFRVWDTRLFVDAELGDDVRVGDVPVIRNVGFTFEWNLVRNGDLANDVGLAYVDFEGLFESEWLNLRVGRFQIPFGEAYRLYSKGYADRSFSSQPVGGPWWWDEGVLLHGASTSGRLGYVASVTNGDTEFGDVGGDAQATLKLWAQPCSFFYASLSGLWADALGGVDGSLWLGEGWARPFGSGGPPIPNVVDGTPVADDPDGLGQTWALAADVILTPTPGLRVWLSGGRYEIDSRGAARYDRTLWYWLGEVLAEGELVHPTLRPFFLGVRVDGVGTWDQDRGYLLDVRYTADLGYNMEHLIAYTVVAGWHVTEYVTLRSEYSHRDVDLVTGAAALLPGSTGDEDTWTIEVGIHF
ncbi:MAG: hypothetical protein R3E53_13215 [Myxococcota bacterium]|nr:hypothetical protein [Myxococcales bacterium]